MRLLRRGQVTIREAALIGDVSRQRVRAWCEAAGVDPVKARAEWLGKLLKSLDRKRKP